MYSVGEPIHMELTLTNASRGNTANPVIVEWFPPLVDLETPDQQMIKTFPAGSEEKIDHWRTSSYILTWDQKDDTGKQASPGWYSYTSTYYLIINGNQVRSTIHYQVFLIQYSQGAIQKTIELNQSQSIPGASFINPNTGKSLS